MEEQERAAVLQKIQENEEYRTKIINRIIDQKLKNRKSVNKEITQNHLIFVEHPNVYTLGKSGDINNLLLSKEDLEKKEIQFFLCFPIIT